MFKSINRLLAKPNAKERLLKHLAIVAIALTLKGCATIYTVLDKNEKNKIYSGLGEHIRLQCVDFTCYDLPLSVWLDTYFLPLTVPMTAYNYFLYEEEEKYDPTDDRIASANMEIDLYVSPTQGNPPEADGEFPEPYAEPLTFSNGRNIESERLSNLDLDQDESFETEGSEEQQEINELY